MKTQAERSPVIVHSNQLTEARYTLTVGEQRLILAMISMINRGDEDFKQYEIRVQDLAELLNLKNKNIYEQLEIILQRIMERVLHIPQKNGYLKTHWVSSAEYHSGKGSVSLSFDPKLKPYLLQLQEQFTRYSLTVIAQFKSIHTIRIYALLKQYQRIGERTFKLQEFREILGIQESEYQVYYDFKRRIILQAKKEFSQKNKSGAYKSDINFDLEEVREKRKVKYLIFKIREQTYQEELPFDYPIESPLIARLKDYGITEKDATEHFKNLGEKGVSDCLVLYEKNLESGQVKDKSGGYLATLLRKGAGQKPVIEVKAEEEKKKKKGNQEKQKKDIQRAAVLTAECDKINREKTLEYRESLSPSGQEEVDAVIVEKCGSLLRGKKINKETLGKRSILVHYTGWIRENVPGVLISHVEYGKKKRASKAILTILQDV